MKALLAIVYLTLCSARKTIDSEDGASSLCHNPMDLHYDSAFFPGDKTQLEVNVDSPKHYMINGVTAYFECLEVELNSVNLTSPSKTSSALSEVSPTDFELDTTDFDGEESKGKWEFTFDPRTTPVSIQECRYDLFIRICGPESKRGSKSKNDGYRKSKKDGHRTSKGDSRGKGHSKIKNSSKSASKRLKKKKKSSKRQGFKLEKDNSWSKVKGKGKIKGNIHKTTTTSPSISFHSDVPSFVPSDAPSGVPSEVLSEIPTIVPDSSLAPSNRRALPPAPSLSASRVHTEWPHQQPSVSIMPSDV